ncbi:DWNN-domain-containing protein [Rhodotorula sp. JG-1b]|nr:DWNN-domain-containing protein [Rhodotorula sp. JG-1b]
MASSFVFYKFKSQREPSRIAFDGTSITVFDLKKEIIAENKMGKGADFDFAIYHADTEEEYTKDHELIPRSTSVIARRLPPARPGRGNALKYMTGTDESGQGLPSGRGAAPEPRGGVGSGFSKDMYTKRFDGREDPQPSGSNQSVQIPAAAPNDEASAMAAMFAATNTQWQQTQEQMANATPIYRNPNAANRPPPRDNNNAAARPSFRDSGMAHKPPPAGYICYRCGQKGHWIQECPTNSDPAYDNRPRIKRTTGIPKSFLMEVNRPAPKAGDEEEEDEDAVNGVKAGVMITADGGFVVARPDSASWLAHRQITANMSASDIQNLAPTDPDLTCPICSKLLRDAVLTPCCSTAFCDECVSNALLDNDMLCPECETRIKSLEKLKVDEDRRERAKKYVDETVAASKEAAEEERKKIEAEEERRRAAEAKKKAEDEAAAAAADAEAKDGEKADKKPEIKEEDLKPNEEELFPARPEEILNPRKPRPGEIPPPTESPAPDEKPATSTFPQPGATTSAASPQRATSATPTPTASTGAAAAAIPAGMNAAQQAQQLRQQQIRAAQQQQMLAMQAGAGMPNPQMVQQQMFQLTTMLQSPALPPPMRAQLQAQLQQCQMVMMQIQQRMAMQMGMGMPMGMGGGGGGGGAPFYGNAAPTGPRAASGMGPQMVPNGPAKVSSPPAGQKRARTDDGEGSPAAKKATLA